MTSEPAVLAFPAAAVAPEGWHWPKGARTYHYFRGQHSLCGRWVRAAGSVLCEPGTKRAVACVVCAAARERSGGMPAA